MRAIASGDLHIDADGPRAAECKRILGWINERIEALRPDAYLCTGDVYHAASTPADRLLAAEHFTRAAAVCPVFIARGNHDKLSDLEIIGQLRSAHSIIVEERAGVYCVAGAKVAILAWPNRASLAAMGGRPIGSEGLDDAARVAMREILSWVADGWRGEHGPKVLLGHFMCNGSVTSTGQPLIGAELSVSTSDLDLAGADVVIMGHVHKPQAFDDGSECPKYYCGSPYRTAFGEVEEKSVVLLDFDADGAAIVTRMVTPASQMILATGGWVPSLGRLLIAWEGEIAPGAEIRLRYTVPAEHRDKARADAATARDTWISEGAGSVKIEEQVETHTRARSGAADVAQAVGLTAKLDGYWAVKGDVPSDDARVRLLGKVNGLES